MQLEEKNAENTRTYCALDGCHGLSESSSPWLEMGEKVDEDKLKFY